MCELIDSNANMLAACQQPLPRLIACFRAIISFFLFAYTYQIAHGASGYISFHLYHTNGSCVTHSRRHQSRGFIPKTKWATQRLRESRVIETSGFGYSSHSTTYAHPSTRTKKKTCFPLDQFSFHFVFILLSRDVDKFRRKGKQYVRKRANDARPYANENESIFFLFLSFIRLNIYSLSIPIQVKWSSNLALLVDLLKNINNNKN